MPQESNRGSHRNGGKAHVLPTSDRAADISKPHNIRSSIASTPDPILYGISFILVAMGLAFLIIGSVYAVECPVIPMVPIWLVIMGVIMFVGGAWHGILARRIKKKPFSKIKPVEKAVSIVIVIVYIVWFIAGNVWIYKAWAESPDYGHSWFDNYCNKSVFLLSFCTIIGMDSFVGIFLIVLCFWGLSQIIVRE